MLNRMHLTLAETDFQESVSEVDGCLASGVGPEAPGRHVDKWVNCRRMIAMTHIRLSEHLLPRFIPPVIPSTIFYLMFLIRIALHLSSAL